MICLKRCFFVSIVVCTDFKGNAALNAGGPFFHDQGSWCHQTHSCFAGYTKGSRLTCIVPANLKAYPTTIERRGLGRLKRPALLL